MKEPTLILPNGEELKFPYFEFGNFLESYIHQWMTLSEKNREEFEAFKKDYQTFKPFLDFAICRLGFKIKNPLIFEETILYGENDNLKLERMNIVNITLPYKRATDQNYNIEKIYPYYLTSSVIDMNGIKYDINYEENFHHDDLFELLFIEYVVNNQSLYEDYIKNIKKDYYQTLDRYFRGRLGFTQIAKIESRPSYDDDLKINLIPDIRKKEFLIVHNSELANDWFNEFIKIAKDIYKVREYNEEYQEPISNFIRGSSDKNESRRI